MLLSCFCFAISTFAEDPNYQKGVTLGEMILKEQLKQEFSLVTESKPKIDTHSKPERCMTIPIQNDPETSLYAFLSFSIPEEKWLLLSEEIIRFGGIIILKGLPNNSFNELAVRMNALRNRGMKAQVQIDPELFNRFGINSVPTFVKIKKDHFNKISGNISLAFALEKIE